MSRELNLNCIKQWKKIILSGDVGNLEEIIHKNATFYSPVVFTPQVGKKKVVYYLSNAVKIFKYRDFKYTNIIKNENYFSAEFEAIFDKVIVNGIDIISTKHNLIYEFKVFLRPLQGIEAVWKEMGKQLNIT